MWHVWGVNEMHAGLWWEFPKVRNYQDNLRRGLGYSGSIVTDLKEIWRKYMK
jgi:hypothetical protein